jgi:NADPH2:quinone reductase
VKALVCESLEDGAVCWQAVAEPEPDEQQLLVAVKAASVNFPDALLTRGRYQVRLQPPFVPGMEIAGEVIAVGSATSGYAVGDRVAAVLPQFGGFAERIAVSPEFTCKLPAELPFDVAACVPSVYATAYYGLVNRALLIPGETVLVLGATGGVGMAAISLAKAMGAQVVAAVGSEEKAALASRLGADHVINYSIQDLKLAVKDYTGGVGADIVVDPVGGELTEQALRAIAWGGRHLVIGFAAGDIPAVATNLLLLKSASLVGVNFGGYTSRFTGPAQEINQQVLAMMASDKSLWPLISRRIPMAEGGEAIARLLARTGMGKIVLTLENPGTH